MGRVRTLCVWVERTSSGVWEGQDQKLCSWRTGGRVLRCTFCAWVGRVMLGLWALGVVTSCVACVCVSLSWECIGAVGVCRVCAWLVG